MPKSDQGVTLDRYMLIPRTLIFLTRGSKVLLIKGAPTKRLWANLYNGIGGHIERGEDPLSAARRELIEETGLQGRNLRMVGSVVIDTGDQFGITLFVFRGEAGDVELVPSPEGQLEWIDIDRLGDYPLVEDLKVLIPRVLSMRPQDAPFSARYYYDEQDQIHIVFGI